MRKAVDPCLCIARFLNAYPRLPPEKLNGKTYHDELCSVTAEHNVIYAVAYAVAAGSRYKLNECTMTLW